MPSYSKIIRILAPTKEYRLTNWLSTTKKEVELRGWDELDVILSSGDAYVDHSSFGVAAIGRILEAEGLRMAIVPQPNWRDDLHDFRKLGHPCPFFDISAGCVDSMVNKYTANKCLHSNDAYTPDGRSDMRPKYPSIVYSQTLKKLYPDVPVILGGTEVSMRRLSHYDYRQDQLKKSILCESGADMLIYDMGGKPICELVRRLTTHNEYWDSTTSPFNICRSSLTTISQTAYLTDEYEPDEQDIVFHSHGEYLVDKKRQFANFRYIEGESNKYAAARIIQAVDNKVVVVDPPYPPVTQEELSYSSDLPYTRLPHPKYEGKCAPTYDMIKFSINIHRGCFGGCVFYMTSAHQGKFTVSRSKENILKGIKEVVQLPDFKGNLSDLGGPSANMYKMGGRDLTLCKRCKRPSCIYPKVRPNLNTDHRSLLDIYHTVDSLPEIKRSFIGSGVRYDLLLYQNKDPFVNKSAAEYTRELIARHVSGRLKVAPEHISDWVPSTMRRPVFS